MLKKYFSLTNNFNIFNLASLIFIVLGLYNKGVFFILFGIYIDMIPKLYTAFISYKDTRKIKFISVVDTIIFLFLTYLFLYKLFLNS